MSAHNNGSGPRSNRCSEERFMLICGIAPERIESDLLSDLHGPMDDARRHAHGLRDDAEVLSCGSLAREGLMRVVRCHDARQLRAPTGRRVPARGKRGTSAAPGRRPRPNGALLRMDMRTKIGSVPAEGPQPGGRKRIAHPPIYRWVQRGRETSPARDGRNGPTSNPSMPPSG